MKELKKDHSISWEEPQVEETSESNDLNVMDESDALNRKLEEMENREAEVSVPEREETSFDLLHDDYSPLPSDNGQEESKKMTMQQLKDIFDAASDNVKEATIIFNKNIEMKKSLEDQFVRLKQAEALQEQKKQENMKLVNEYKEEVLADLNDQKDKLEQDRNQLKLSETVLVREKEKFEKRKQSEMEEFETMKQEHVTWLADEKEKLKTRELELQKGWEEMEREKKRLEEDRAQYLIEKEELADSLMRFNQLVGDFTVGIDRFNIE